MNEQYLALSFYKYYCLFILTHNSTLIFCIRGYVFTHKLLLKIDVRNDILDISDYININVI